MGKIICPVIRDDRFLECSLIRGFTIVKLFAKLVNGFVFVPRLFACGRDKNIYEKFMWEEKHS